jgi:hypothetical protein
MPNLLHWLSQSFNQLIASLEQTLRDFSQPAHFSIALTIVTDLPQSKSQLIAENAMLR